MTRDAALTGRPPRPALSRAEFIAMIAMLFATVAFSIDSMLPALPDIAAELTPGNENRAQLILTAFILGMGLGTFVAGPISDAIGRKRAILGGAALYTLGAALASAAQTLELVLAARLIQGLGAAGPRVVSLALVRDLYAGRQMARIVSIAMMIFTTVPAIAPALSTGVIALAGWRGIFAAFILFSLISAGWLGLRQPETLPPAARRPLQPGPLWQAVREVLANRVVRIAIATQSLAFGALFGTIASVQQIYDIRFGLGASFPYWFAATALISAGGSFLNARLVMRLGMRALVSLALGAQLVISGAMTVVFAAGVLPAALAFPAFFFWITCVFFMVAPVLGNLNALALEPMGHVAGTASSVTGALGTVLGVLLGAPIGLAFDGTPVPLMASVAVLAGLGVLLMRAIARAD